MVKGIVIGAVVFLIVMFWCCLKVASDEDDWMEQQISRECEKNER